MTIYVYVVDHPNARVLIDTGMTELLPGADMELCLLLMSSAHISLCENVIASPARFSRGEAIPLFSTEEIASLRSQ